jgi:hypothetical protein
MSDSPPESATTRDLDVQIVYPTLDNDEDNPVPLIWDDDTGTYYFVSEVHADNGSRLDEGWVSDPATDDEWEGSQVRGVEYISVRFDFQPDHVPIETALQEDITVRRDSETGSTTLAEFYVALPPRGGPTEKAEERG